MEINLGDWLLKELNARSMSQAGLARLSGVTPAQISRILSGQRGAGNDALRGIARALQLPIETVFRAAGELPPLPPQTERQEQLLHIFSLLSEKDQAEILRYARYFLNTRPNE